MSRNQSNTQASETNAPALIAWYVADRGEKSFWTRIGAAWEHQDGEGLTLQLDLVPTGGGNIVLRNPRKSEGAAQPQG